MGPFPLGQKPVVAREQNRMDRDKLMKMAGAVRTGGKGSVRRCANARIDLRKIGVQLGAGQHTTPAAPCLVLKLRTELGA